jgi:hypothetical protein
MGAMDRLLLGSAVLMSAATLVIAYLFRFDGYGASFSRLSSSLGFVFGYWVVAAAVAALIYFAGRIMNIRLPMFEIYCTLVCGGCAVGILEAFR